jgi:hypothetical protein
MEKQALENLVRKNKWADLFEALPAVKKNNIVWRCCVYQLESRWHKAEQDYHKGTLSYEAKSIEHNRLRESCLFLINNEGNYKLYNTLALSLMVLGIAIFSWIVFPNENIKPTEKLPIADSSEIKGENKPSQQGGKPIETPPPPQSKPKITKDIPRYHIDGIVVDSLDKPIESALIELKYIYNYLDYNQLKTDVTGRFSIEFYAKENLRDIIVSARHQSKFKFDTFDITLNNKIKIELK